MAVLHFSQGNLNRRHQTRRPSRLARPGLWNEPDPFGVSKGIVLTGIGLASLSGFAAAEFANADIAWFSTLQATMMHAAVRVWATSRLS
jgi:hypothetical protein